MMFGLLSSSGSFLGWWDDREDAILACQHLFDDEPGTREECSLLSFHPNGLPAGEVDVP